MYNLKRILKALVLLILIFYAFLFSINYSNLLVSSDVVKKRDLAIISLKCYLHNQTVEQECFRNDQNEIYVPYSSFLMKKFDLHGKLENDEFRLLYTYTKIHYPIKKYEFHDQFLWFKDVYVEARDRVKLMSGKYGVPVSSQWFEKGHIYPVQVAQYGLSYYSRWKSNKNVESKSIKLDYIQKWKFLRNEQNSIVKTENGIEFNLNDKATYQINLSVNSVLFFMANIYTSGSISIFLNLDFYEYPEESRISLVYEVRKDVESDAFEIHKVNSVLQIKYSVSGHAKILRNIYVDVCKALKSKQCLLNYTNSTRHFTVLNMNVRGVGVMQEPVLTDSASFEIAKQAADYLLSTQDRNTGAWPMKVIRKFRKNDHLYLNSSWKSAMLQGHAMSLLTRLFYATQKKNYLTGALNAANVFKVNASENGVRTYFLDKYVWYEEYPTKPNSLLVLNGFVYSLFGLFDLYNCLNSTGNEQYRDVYKLYQDGIVSLKNMITWFDTGSRTFYDLRHLTNAAFSEPNIARWDYHVLHINLLLHLFTVHQDQSFLQTLAHRWIKYTNGYWSEHN